MSCAKMLRSFGAEAGPGAGSVSGCQVEWRGEPTTRRNVLALRTELEGLLAAQGLDDDVRRLALAALSGEEAVGAVLSQPGDLSVGVTPGPEPAPESASPHATPGAYLSTIEVSGFRGIGATARLEVAEGPGLTVVVGRNGSGKSSFAEALEVLLTGDSWRWRNKSVEWKQGWRNLHQPAARVEASFRLEGERAPLVLSKEWDDDESDVTRPDTVAQVTGQPRTDLGGIGWVEAIDLYRPLLSHPELAEVANEPSRLFDALYGVLGLEHLTAAGELLRKRRLALQAPLKSVKKERTDLIEFLAATADDRAAAVRAAIDGRSWDLEAAEAAATVVEPATGKIAGLDALSRLSVPGPEEVESAAVALDIAVERLERLGDSEPARAGSVARLLEKALAHHDGHGDQQCPVCGGAYLDAGWRREAEIRLEELRRVAAEYDQAVTVQKAAVKTALGLVQPVPEALEQTQDLTELGIDVDAAAEAWKRWSSIPDDPSGIADHLGATYPGLADEVARVVSDAAKHRAGIEDSWRPVARRVLTWVAEAVEALSDDEKAKSVKKAEDALAAAMVEMRSRRFEPISRQAIDLWESLRLQSNVELTGVDLAGKGSRRRVDLKVSVDGAEGSALGVVSQGEVNCLALSLFFPRVMMEGSPFKFIVIDDPVQAMDPARVDGLARVLSDIAATHQVIVFTHDDRLPASLRRLNLAHTVLEVTRRPGSQVEVRRSIDPVNQYFLDARAVAKDENLPDGVASRVVPGFCRSAVEAACMEAVRRRRIGRGDPHVAVERELASATTTTTLASLALFDDADSGGRVLGEINSRWGRSAGDVLRDVQSGVHKGFSGSLQAMIEEAQRLAAGLRAAK